MIFYHKPYYNPNNINVNKKIILVIYALNLKDYTNFTNYIMQNKQIEKNIGKKIETKI